MNWLERTVDECFRSPYELLSWYVLNMDTLKILCLKDLLEAFLTYWKIERIDLSDWPTYHLGAGVQEIEGVAPFWLKKLDEQMGWYPSGPHKSVHSPSSIIANIAWAWDNANELMEDWGQDRDE